MEKKRKVAKRKKKSLGCAEKVEKKKMYRRCGENSESQDMAGGALWCQVFVGETVGSQADLNDPGTFHNANSFKMLN